jgi:NADH-quinone oxidoreductase subunit N
MPVTVQAILPELLLLITGMLVLLLDPFWRDENRRLNLGWLTAGGLTLTLLLSLWLGLPGESVLAFGGMVRFDWLGFVFKLFLIFCAAITALFMMDVEQLSRRAEAYLLLIAATIGMCFMASASDLVMMYLAVETTSIPLYVLAGFMLQDNKSTEAGFKYLLFGAMTSAVLLYGLSLLYGFAGTTSLDALAPFFGSMDFVSLGLLFLLLVGLGFKVSVVPFHFWAPDTYEGAPTPIAGYLSTASKAAGFALLLRLFLVAFPDVALQWQWILAVLAVLTMTIGNLVALAQKNIKRLVAYSSIAHAGYAMIGLVAYNELGIASVVFYMIAYILTNLAAFGIITAFGRITGSEEIDSYRGMSRRSPFLALALLAAFLSLSGMPPFGGFIAKVLVFAAGVQTGWTWLVVVGILNSVVGLYYYLEVIKVVYLYRMENEDEQQHPIAISRPYAIALVILTLGIILVGTVFGPWFGLSQLAAANLF